MQDLDLWIDLSAVIKGQQEILRVNKEYPINSFSEIDNDLTLSSPVVLVGEITNVCGNLFLKGNLSFKMQYLCDRCLEEYECECSVAIEEVLAKSTSTEDDEDVILYSGGKVLLCSAIYKCIYPLILDKHLCKDDCKGLCPKCGCNLNEKECNCADDEIDPRLEKLKDFFKK